MHGVASGLAYPPLPLHYLMDDAWSIQKMIFRLRPHDPLTFIQMNNVLLMRKVNTTV
jgi:hypothetical protein